MSYRATVLKLILTAYYSLMSEKVLMAYICNDVPYRQHRILLFQSNELFLNSSHSDMKNLDVFCNNEDRPHLLFILPSIPNYAEAIAIYLWS